MIKTTIAILFCVAFVGAVQPSDNSLTVNQQQLPSNTESDNAYGYVAPDNVLMEEGRQLRSQAHYERKEAREARRSQEHLAKAEKAKSYRRQQKQLYKANKHAFKAEYAATMGASKAGILSGRQLRSQAHYERKEAREARRSQEHLAKAEKAKSYRRQQKQLYK